jgi:hypothetical protein
MDSPCADGYHGEFRLEANGSHGWRQRVQHAPPPPAAHGTLARPTHSPLLLHLTFWKMEVISSLAVLLHLFYLFETLQAKYVEAVGPKQQVTGVGDQQAINSSSNSEKALLCESNELRKRGLCLVPISMLIDYLG